MKKPHTLIVVILLTLVMLACTCNFADRLMSPIAEIEPTATMEPTGSLTLAPTDTPTPEPTLGIGSTMVNPIDGAVLVYVPEGEFLMGSEDEDASDEEKPEHTVYLDAYWIYQHPVTNAQFAAFVDASGYQTTAEEAGWSDDDDVSQYDHERGAYWGAPEGPGSSIAGRDDHPVVWVSWFDAAAYCEWADGRLLMEAEWEKAARGTDGCKYPWGNQLVTGDKANYCDVNCPNEWAEKSQDDGYERTSPVGSYPAGASPYGALDMAGNVWEWVADWFDDYYSHSPYENPTGPTSGTYRVLRGGSWYINVRNLRVSSRFSCGPVCRSNDFGFRCQRTP